MAYEVLARKWRPSQFDDVVGQRHVTETLKNAIRTRRIAHAYLFVGPRGIGKTSVARIFAKALNCREGPTLTPCDRCDSCVEIARGASLDVQEIDGASTGGVEQVRALRETLKYAPTRAPYKIYIIDEVHMLSAGAFNALLKTLEEPPPHVKFEFATTEPQKILPTIISRCQRFDLRRIPAPMIMDRLRTIAAAEQVTVTEDALLAIARGAEGGLRDAESALDQLISFKGDQLEEADVLAVFGLVSRQALEELVSMTLRGDMPGVIHSVAGMDEQGKDLQRLVFDLIDHLKNMLICGYVDTVSDRLDLAEAQVSVLRGHMRETTPDHVLRLIRILTETEQRMRYALLRRTLLETALIRCARAATAATLDQVLQEIQALQAATADAEPAAAPPAARPGPAAPASGPVSAPGATGTSASAAASSARPARDPAADLRRLEQRWDQVRERAGKAVKLSARTMLADALPLAVEGDRVRVGFDPQFADEIDQFAGGRNRKALELALGDVLGRKILLELGEIPADRCRPPADPAGKEASAATQEGPTEAAVDAGAHGPDAARGARKPAARLLDDPAVHNVMDMFDANVVEVRR